jgi:hypothetical protein
LWHEAAQALAEADLADAILTPSPLLAAFSQHPRPKPNHWEMFKTRWRWRVNRWRYAAGCWIAGVHVDDDYE